MGTADPSEFVAFGDVARHRLGMQCQYARKLLLDPVLSKGVRWQGRIEDYHNLRIHRDDVEAFVEVVQAHRRATGQIP